jgi:hypothetical protein
LTVNDDSIYYAVVMTCLLPLGWNCVLDRPIRLRHEKHNKSPVSVCFPAQAAPLSICCAGARRH